MEPLLRRAFSNRTVRFAIGGAFVGLLALAAMFIMRGRDQPTLVLKVEPVSDPSQIRVYIGGAVATPGLYTLPRGSRVAEAIAAAGGLTPEGDTSALGMAALLEDADQIIVPGRPITPTPALAPAAATATTAPQTGSTPDTPTASTPTAASPVPAPTSPPAAPTATNINTASATELEALPGIGPAIAARIVDYRQTNGPFQSVDELEAIKGISAKMVEALRPLVTIGP